MSTTTDVPSKPFQFSLRQLLLLMAVCSFGLALLFRLGPIGYIVCYFLVCLAIAFLGTIRARGDWFWLASCCLFIGGFCLATLFLPVFESLQSARHMSCQNNLHQLGIALHNYHDTYGSFPPAYIADASGKPMHSWRV